MILVTSANGKIGGDIVSTLLSVSLSVRAYVRSATTLRPTLEGADIFAGDLFDREALKSSMKGVRSVVHISPPHHPGEFALGQAMIEAAADAGVEHFVLLSAIHPILNALPAHRMKRMVEESLIDARLPYTILQPTIFMQNTDLKKVLDSGVWSAPYSVHMPFSFVDRLDVAAVALKVLTEPGHLHATYMLAGTEPTSIAGAAEILSEVSGKSVAAKEIPAYTVLDQFPRDTAEQRYTADTFERMFAYYNRHGLTGNSNVLGWMLGRKPTGFRAYFERELGTAANTTH